MLWHIDALTPTADIRTAQLTDGLRLHLRHSPFTSILMRIGAAERAYLALAPCPGCDQNRCRIGCHAELLRRLLRACIPNVTLRPVSRGLAPRHYARMCLAWPTERATMPPPIDPDWSDLRLELHWRPGAPPRLSMLLATGNEGPEPKPFLRNHGWQALALPQQLARPWLREYPLAIPFGRPAADAPGLLFTQSQTVNGALPVARTPAPDDITPEELAAPESPGDAVTTRLLTNLRAVLAGERPFRRIMADAPSPTDEAAARAAIDELSPFPSGPGTGKSAMAPGDVGAWIDALLAYPQGHTRRTIAALLREPHKEHAALLLLWLDHAGVLGAPTDSSQPYRYPRPLLLQDSGLLAERLRATPLPDINALAAAKGHGL